MYNIYINSQHGTSFCDHDFNKAGHVGYATVLNKNLKSMITSILLLIVICIHMHTLNFVSCFINDNDHNTVHCDILVGQFNDALFLNSSPN